MSIHIRFRTRIANEMGVDKTGGALALGEQHDPAARRTERMRQEQAKTTNQSIFVSNHEIRPNAILTRATIS